MSVMGFQDIAVFFYLWDFFNFAKPLSAVLVLHKAIYVIMQLLIIYRIAIKTNHKNSL